MRFRPILKWIVYALLFLLFLTLQTGVLPRVRVLGAHPNILPFIAVTVAVLEGSVAGGAFGFFTGLWCDAVIPHAEAIHAVFFLAAGILAGVMTERFFKKTFVTAFLCGLVALAAFDVLYFLIFCFIPQRAAFYNLFLVAGPEIGLTALCAPFVYWPLRVVHKRLGDG